MRLLRDAADATGMDEVRLSSGTRTRSPTVLQGALAVTATKLGEFRMSDYVAGEGQTRPPGSEYTGKAFTFHQVRETIYLAVATGNLSAPSNCPVVINDEDVLVADSNISPGAAWALKEELKEITDKPIRHVVLTHFHFDHAHGSQIYAPEVDIIGHEYTHEMIATGESINGRTYTTMMAGLPDELEGLRRQIREAPDGTARIDLERQLRIRENFSDASASVTPVPPKTTLSDRMTSYHGGREFRFMYLGRGHTGGDLLVHIPEEGVLITGDLLLEGLPYMGDGYFRDWPGTLEKLKELDFEVMLPGHGLPFADRTRIDTLQGYMEDFGSQVTDLFTKGASAGEAAEKIDMRGHAQYYAAIEGVGVGLPAVLQAYDLLSETAD
jgi:glyoxylase-like metal-dependent hydrolase (beta-lactamase superfamily II)